MDTMTSAETLSSHFTSDQILPASFRDPSGFLFCNPEGDLLRQVNRCFADDFRHFVDSGLYADLAKDGLIIDHEELSLDHSLNEDAVRVLRPRLLPFVSYPYEWSFSALQDAALLTLELQRRAIQAGMCLKDASAYNVQFHGIKPIFIDTLSFERWSPDTPWIAYGQFCQHFLAPLALMARRDIDLQKLLRLHIDGIPLPLASKLLPWSTRFRLGTAMHVHLHSQAVKRFENSDQPNHHPKAPRVSQHALLALVESLQSTIESFRWRPRGTEWADYYEDNSYTAAMFDEKQQVVDSWLEQIQPQSVWDLGANCGVFSRLAGRHSRYTVAFDIDGACVERNYLNCRQQSVENLLPLAMDLTNPSTALGWAHQERMSLIGRGPCDTTLALALIHHLAISNNVPLPRIADFFARLGRALIIEFVPKSDTQVQRLLRSRRDVFPDYQELSFTESFGQYFDIIQRHSLRNSGRVLFWMKSKLFTRS